MATRVGKRLKDSAFSGRTVTLKLRRYDFTTLTRSQTLPQPTDDARQIALALRGMWPGSLQGMWKNEATRADAESAAVMQVYMAAELGISPMMAFLVADC